MNLKNRHMLQFAIFSVIMMISLLIGLVVYYNSLLTNLEKTIKKTQDEVLWQEQYNFSKALEADKLVLKGFSETCAMGLEDEQGLMGTLDTIQRSTDFEYATFARPDGTSINNKGDISNVVDRGYFHSAMSGDTVISEPIQSKIRDAYIIVAATPVVRDGEIVGVLIGSFEAKKLSAWFVNSFDGYGYTYIATNTGELIVKSGNEYALAETGNLFDLFQDAEFSEVDSYETMRQNLVNGKGGQARYIYHNEERLVHYDKLDINDWNIFVVVSPQGVESTANLILCNTVLLTGVVTLIFIALLLYNMHSQKCFTRELTKLAYVDGVTGCPTFGKFQRDAAELVRTCVSGNYMLLKMDIDKFKLINEMYGMETGNKVLVAIAEALTLALDEKVDSFGRIHADEFILLMAYGEDQELNQKQKLFESTVIQMTKELVDFRLVLPCGRYRLEEGECDLEGAYEKVNFAHRLAKSSDSQDLFYDGKVKEQAIREKELESKMEDALLNEEFQLFLQPKHRMSDGKMIGAEALVRWFVGSDTIAYPSEFISLFEQNGFVMRLDMYMFEKSCQRLHTWREAGIAPISVSINFSRRHLSNPNFVQELCEIADRYQVPHELLEVELTETAMLENLDVLSRVLDALHKAGFTLSMDDFGTGYSSLGLLKDIAVDVIKIDKQFFERSKDLNRARTVIESVIDMARKLEIHTVAEGVETQEHMNLLRELGCEIAQGYYFAKPMPAVELEVKLLRELIAQDH